MPTKSGGRRRGLAGALLVALPLAGCGLFHRAPPLPPIVILQPPILIPAPLPPPMPPPTSYAVLAVPAEFDWAVEMAPPPPRPAPRRPPEAPAGTPPAVAQARPPQLSPSLTPQQLAAYRGQTLAALQRARHDLALLANRRLSGSASATRAQAGEYVRQAEQALADGDLVRAQTLAAKAETLARFLLGE